jgi:predicted NUDIX family NTP pyrophosphohydrolase
MIEGDFNAFEIVDPRNGCRIVACSCCQIFRTDEIGDGTDMAARIAIGLRINSDERQTRRFNAGFFHEFTLGGGFYCLANLDETARQSKIALEGRIFPPDHKHAASGVDDDAIGGEERRFGRRHGNSIYVESSNVKTSVSAGLLLYRRRPELEVLLGHPGGPYWRNKDDGAWTVPKGEIQDNEDPYRAALREFAEETGFRPHGNPVSLGSLRQTGGKLVYVWAVEDDWDPAKLISNRFSIEWPPRTGKRQEFPEIDKAAWFDLPTALRKILKSQAEFLNRLNSGHYA